ncbi:MAG: radical SAM protein [Rhodospirillaceae bacterium]|nr:radical SAM protein [Rhodospirillaceae bacterium]
MKQKIILADLTHTAQGISSLCFPLGVSYVASYAKETLGEFYDFELSKFPEDLTRSFLDQPPVLLGLSCYSWNMELSLAFSRWAKKQAPDLVVVFGGPNFPTDASEKDDFLKQRPEIDFYLENEGEIGFVELINKLRDYEFSADALKKNSEIIGNCNYLYDGKLIEGEVQRILDINMIPSPYLTGMMDKFFKLPLEPMIETTRGCPFSCAFCADGMASKNRIVRYDHERTRDELAYIGEHIQQNKDIDALLLTDLNFGMYTQDYKTAEYIRGIQDKYGWPRVLKGSAGKNKPERVIEAVSLLKDSWLIGSAIQSSDPEVLKNIKRSNISTDAYQKFIDYANKGGKNSQSYTEIILALPGDTKEKHLKSLRGGIENKVNTVKMYQAMLLFGTSMASLETRKEFQLLTKFRAMPGCVGGYKFGDEEARVAEVEEIVVGGKDMPFEDYVACRVMNLLI